MPSAPMTAVWPLVGRQDVLRRIAEAMRRPGCAGVVLVGAAAALIYRWSVSSPPTALMSRWPVGC